MSPNFKACAISWWVTSARQGCWLTGWEPRAWVVSYTNISSTSSHLDIAVLAGLRGQAVFTGFDGWSTPRDTASFQTYAELRHILLWSFWLTNENLTFLPVSPWGWGHGTEEEKAWFRPYVRPLPSWWMREFMMEMQSQSLSTYQTVIMNTEALLMLTSGFHKAQFLTIEERGCGWVIAKPPRD